MKPIFKLFFDVSEQRYYIYYNKDLTVLLYRVDNINPLNISRVTEIGAMHTQISKPILKEMEEFAIEEFRKMETGF